MSTILATNRLITEVVIEVEGEEAVEELIVLDEGTRGRGINGGRRIGCSARCGTRGVGGDALREEATVTSILSSFFEFENSFWLSITSWILSLISYIMPLSKIPPAHILPLLPYHL